MAENFFDFQKRMTRERQSAATDDAGPPPARDSLSVTQLTNLIDKAIRDGVPASLVLRAELSTWKRHGASGHAYFTLKDAQNCIDCVMWRSEVARLRFEPRPGVELLASGHVKVYAGKGKYQFYATTLEPVGQGALELAFRQMHARLRAEGLFDESRRKPLPAYPARVALVTSQSTAAVQDMLKVLRRFPWVRLFLYHVPVQGDGAAPKIAQAIADLNACPLRGGAVDLILLGRGGGSLEDLWAFNEEVVARAVAASDIPVVTGIGHEVDTSIADLVADYHAHTPTEAAQVVMAQWKQAGGRLDTARIRLRRDMRTLAKDWRHRLSAVERHDFFRHPMEPVNQLRQVVDDRHRSLTLAVSECLREARHRLASAVDRFEQCRPHQILARLRARLGAADVRLCGATARKLALARERLHALAGALADAHPRHAIGLARQRLASVASRLDRAAVEQHGRRVLRLNAARTCFNAVIPQNVLKRGYSLTRLARTGEVVRAAEALKPGDRLVTRFADGEVQSVVEDVKQLRLF